MTTYRLSVVLLPLLAAASAAPPQIPEQLPDIDVLYIERTPRYPGYALDYGRKGSEGVPILVGNRTRKLLTASEAKAVKRWPAPGEKVTFTAHVQNRGSATAPPWEYAWQIDGKPTSAGKLPQPQPVGGEITAVLEWRWQPGRHFVRFTADPLLKIHDAAPANNSREDAT